MSLPAARFSLLSAGVLLALGAVAAEPETSLTVYSSATPGAIPAEWYRPLPGMGSPSASQLPGFALVRLERELHDRVRLDCGTFHADRLAELQLSAKVAAQRVRETRTEFRFNPMSSADRRIVHLALHGAPGVRTASEGVGEQRRVVIFPANAR